jgi:CRP/FNR family cyclic AMP-dependent transcriptional regulator
MMKYPGIGFLPAPVCGENLNLILPERAHDASMSWNAIPLIEATTPHAHTQGLPAIAVKGDIAMERPEDRPIDFRLFKDTDSVEAAYPAGAVIIAPGTANAMMYIVKKGVIAVQIEGVTVEQITEGNIFGEMGIVDPRPHTANVFAVTDVTLYVINREQFLQLVGKAPTFSLRVMRILARRIRAMNSRLSKAERAVA